MTKFLILGDIHTNIIRCVKLCQAYPDHIILQLGDLGVGFVDTFYLVTRLPGNFKFFPGNHDNRQEALKMPQCLGNFGEYKGLFFVSGASSKDKDDRIAGVSWWADEELTHQQANYCLSAWKKSDSKVIISHDCPHSFAQQSFGVDDKSHTRNLLEAMINIRKPELLISGHHHKNFIVNRNGIKWVSLGIDRYYELTI